MSKEKIRKGSKFGRLTTVKEVAPHFTPSGGKYRKFLCHCECGAKREVLLSHMKSGNTVSCGCFNKELVTKHGLSGTSLDFVWYHMIQRCYTDTCKEYVHYGERGITVCRQWRESKQAFFDWANSNGYLKGLEIDRKNNDGNYNPRNCRWVTKSSNQRNKRNAFTISYGGKRVSLRDAVDQYGTNNLSYGTVRRRISDGWDPKEAMT